MHIKGPGLVPTVAPGGDDDLFEEDAEDAFERDNGPILSGDDGAQLVGVVIQEAVSIGVVGGHRGAGTAWPMSQNGHGRG